MKKNKTIIIRIDSLLTHIDLVLEDVKDVEIEKMPPTSLLIRATCFSISQIGEMMVQLEDKLLPFYPDLPWKLARQTRNFIVHDYDNTDLETVKNIVEYDLPLLKESFIKIREELTSKLDK